MNQMSQEVYLIDGVRSAIGNFGGSLAPLRADDLAAQVLAALIARHPKLDAKGIEDVLFGCANQAGEDNRNVARMASLLAGLPIWENARTFRIRKRVLSSAQRIRLPGITPK
jgi:acetyl-CoA acetyltransferase